jgi:hypothetical protein
VNAAGSDFVNKWCRPVKCTYIAGLPRTEGWLKAAAFGSAEIASAPPHSHTPASPLLLLGLSPAHSPATPSISTAGASTSMPPGTPAAASAAHTTCSEFAARIAEAVYTCLHYALVFLQATSPQVSYEAFVYGMFMSA